MVLSNAERQRRYRNRLKAAARGADLGERVRVAVDEAIEALWSLSKRTGDGTFDGFADLAALRVSMASERDPAGSLRQTLTAFAGDEGGTAEELTAIERALGILDAASLRHVEVPKATKGRKR